ATNIREVNTKGVEIDASYNFKINNYLQSVSIGYSHLDDNILEQNEDLSRYSLNTLKNQFIGRLNTKFTKNLSQNIVYKHGERTTGSNFNVLDASIIYSLQQTQFTITASNIFDADYIETGFVPMPPSNILFGFRYNFK
ncbi:MAG: TonB-dependent receptor, partial [Bacteroidia bacterium]|nr:TonB-dependent receptor [Bacteroidia bacterium]